MKVDLSLLTFSCGAAQGVGEGGSLSISMTKTVEMVTGLCCEISADRRKNYMCICGFFGFKKLMWANIDHKTWIGSREDGAGTRQSDRRRQEFIARSIS